MTRQVTLFGASNLEPGDSDFRPLGVAVTDGNLVTSRNPDDVDAFMAALIDLIENVPVRGVRSAGELSA